MSLITDLPLASEIRTESRLAPNQINGTFTGIADMEADITLRIAEQASVVEQRLRMKAAPYAWPFSAARLETAYPLYSGAERESVTTQQQTNAGLVVEMFTLSDLYLTAGQVSPEFLDKAKYYQQRGENMLAALEIEVMYIASVLSDNAKAPSSSSFTLYTGRGTYTTSDPDSVGWVQI